MKLEEIPQCAIEGCDRPCFILIHDKWVCGWCAAKWDRKQKEEQFKMMQEGLKDA